VLESRALRKLKLCRADEVPAISYTRYVLDVNSVVGFLHSADVKYAVDVSKVHADSSFTVDMCQVGAFLCMQLYPGLTSQCVPPKRI
jgi:hypothetical protein